MGNETRLLLETLVAVPAALARPELLGRLSEQVPHLQPNDVEAVLRAAATSFPRRTGASSYPRWRREPRMTARGA